MDYLMSWCDANKSNNKALPNKNSNNREAGMDGVVIRRFLNDRNGDMDILETHDKMNYSESKTDDHHQFGSSLMTMNSQVKSAATATAIATATTTVDMLQPQQRGSISGGTDFHHRQHSNHYSYASSSSCYSDAAMKQVLDTLRSSRQTLFQESSSKQEQPETAAIQNNDSMMIEPTPLGPTTSRNLVENVSLADSAWKNGDLNLIRSWMMPSAGSSSEFDHRPASPGSSGTSSAASAAAASLALDQEKVTEDESPSLLWPLPVRPKKRNLDDLLNDEGESVDDEEWMTEIKKPKAQQQQTQGNEQREESIFQHLKEVMWEAQVNMDYDIHENEEEDSFNEELNYCYDYSDDIVKESCSSATTQETPLEDATRTILTSSMSSFLLSSSTVNATTTDIAKNQKKSIKKGSGDRPHSYDSWESHLEDLITFKKEHGHCLVPHDYSDNPKLAQWTKRQRYQYKLKISNQHSTLTEERQQALDELGFTWDLHKAAWLEKLECIKAYKAEHGNTNVPSHYALDPPLAVWVKCQRRQYKLYRLGKQSSMNEERFATLDALGFDWNPRNII